MTHIQMSPIQFIERLIALVPPPRVNLLRYNGCFAGNSKLRPKAVPSTAKIEAQAPSKRERMRWAEMLKRVFDIDVLRCRVCASRMELISTIEDPPVIKRILDHLGLESSAPKLKPANPRGPPEAGMIDEYSQVPEGW